MQHEITSSRPLLDEKGNIAEPGYAKNMLPFYSRAAIKASPMRIKEWDYYLVNNGRFALALTIDDNGYMGLDSISLLDFESGMNITQSPMSLMPLGKIGLPETSLRGDTRHSGKGYKLVFENPGTGMRRLQAKMEKFGPEGDIAADVILTDEPEESKKVH